ncbi:insulin-induced protein-domain-containing protein [Amylocarpus encephaloides]|uniref:Insulin-induced protein-domain-containing protein n=1 Tax=Amylocarpus encephaloides TaxID=45428 RepID=A0A9P7YF04_9HELO|nr:insulin-induced protein-domain-containing protein [Amylocarpus encephaloides]
MSTAGQSPKIYKPKPRRPFDHNSAPHQPPSPLLAPTHPDETPSRTHSILNLTSSTLLGIYSSTGYQGEGEDGEPSTPWGTGAETPYQADPIKPPLSRSQSIVPRSSPSASTKFSLLWRSTLLFGIGMGYGSLVRHLHDDRKLAAVQVEGIIKPSNDWRYLVFWGIAGVALGSLLPWIDTLFYSEASEGISKELQRQKDQITQDDTLDSNSSPGADWTPAVRSVGAFVGIAYAIRKLPWASSLQASLTLFLVNPVLWYLIDRSKPGFVLSSAIGATGTALLLASNPNMMPSPTTYGRTANNSIRQMDMLGELNLMGVGVSREIIECGIWILSVLFCSCVCFGNIGRRLALNGVGLRR